MAAILKKLAEMRKFGGKRDTDGLTDADIKKFLPKHPALKLAINEGYANFKTLRKSSGKLLKLPESDLILALQKDYLNFYAEDARNPYVALAARGPWIITSKGAVLHDSGGYGMLGFGHGPDTILKAMNKPHVMANIMTASFSQKNLTDRLKKEIGHSRKTKEPPFAKYLCLNSGSESVTIAMRLADINTRRLTEPGARHASKTPKILAVKGSFHGRTERPSQASDSSMPKYRKHLASFRNYDGLVTIPSNDVAALREAFAKAERDNVFFEVMMMEPVMGEGNPGQAVTTEFYNAARELTTKHESLLIVDSIQAGLRTHGVLSMVDYPGFQNCTPPDMETYSKALNGGQYPLSVLAMTEATANLYKTGVYGNTMTTNPRACDVACAVLDGINAKFRKNVTDRGQEFIKLFSELQKEFPDVITEVKGTGLLCAVHINPKKYQVVGTTGLETIMRKHGIGVIHGGENALRFTPCFTITSPELKLICEVLRNILKGGMR